MTLNQPTWMARLYAITLQVTHWVIGFDMLGKGDRLGAEEHFAAIEETGDFEHEIYWRGRAFHARVESDPNWLAWLENASHR